MQALIDLAPEIYKGNEARGFWEGGTVARNRDEALMLVVTELSEAVEAHRKGVTCMSKMTAFTGRENLMYSEAWLMLHEFTRPSWKTEFEECVKDTVEDELADTAIRLMDIAAGWGYPLVDTTADCGVAPNPNFAAQCYAITKKIVNGMDGIWLGTSNDNYGRVISYVLQDLSNLLGGNNLLVHVQLKLQYNSHRPYKHGKKY